MCCHVYQYISKLNICLYLLERAFCHHADFRLQFDLHSLKSSSELSNAGLGRLQGLGAHRHLFAQLGRLWSTSINNGIDQVSGHQTAT